MIHHGDLFNVLPTLEADSIDACVTDPPYELSFMGKKWDGTGVAFQPETWREVFRVLKPGAHLVAFGGTRTFHRMTCAIEDAGFEIRDTLCWLYGQGFPKSLDVSKAIDKQAGAEREGVGVQSVPNHNLHHDGRFINPTGARVLLPLSTIPSTDAAKQWEGWGTALKPAWEPIILARKPLNGTVAENVMEHGTGALNIDGCRIEPTGERLGGGGEQRCTFEKSEGWSRPWMSDPEYAKAHSEKVSANVDKATELGRWPANVVLDEDAAAMLDEQSGDLDNCGGPKATNHDSGMFGLGQPGAIYSDFGGASRFMYVAKPSRAERDRGCDQRKPENGGGRRVGSKKLPPYLTVKPIALMRWLVRLATPKGGRVLDPFLGSGTTGIACRCEGMEIVGIEREAEYVEIAKARIASTDTELFAEPESTPRNEK